MVRDLHRCEQTYSCPTCNQPAGKPCVTPSGKATKKHHCQRLFQIGMNDDETLAHQSAHVQNLLKSKPRKVKIYWTYQTHYDKTNDFKGEEVLDCYFRAKGRFFGFFMIRRCRDQKKWSPDGMYWLDTMFGSGSHDYNCGAIKGLAEAKALARSNTEILLASLQGIELA